MGVDRNCVVIADDYGSAAAPGSVKHTAAAADNCQGWEKSLQLNILDVVHNLAVFVTITYVRCNPAGNVILYLEGVDLLFLPQQIVPVVLDNVRRRAGTVLWASGRREWWRARGRTELVRI